MVHMCVKVASIVCFSTVDGFEVVRSFTHWQELLYRSPYTVMTSLVVCVASSHQCVRYDVVYAVTPQGAVPTP